MRIRRVTGSAVRDRIDAADQTIMARLSAERSPVLDGFLPTLSRSADFFALWIGIAAVLAAGRDERGRRAALRGLAGMVTASTASNVVAKGLVRRPRPQVRQGVTDGRKDRQPLVQVADPQHLGHARLRRDERVAAPCLVGVAGDLGEGAEPAGVAKGHAAQIEQQQPGMGGGGAAPRGQAASGGHVQLSGCTQDLDPVAAAGRRRLIRALGHCRVCLCGRYWSMRAVTIAR
jgi:hypothetical protein